MRRSDLRVCLIGIISHMPELRDRIDKKIVVRKHLWGAQATIEA